MKNGAQLQVFAESQGFIPLTKQIMARQYKDCTEHEKKRNLKDLDFPKL